MRDNRRGETGSGSLRSEATRQRRGQHRWVITEFVSVIEQDSNIPVGRIADIHGEGMRSISRRPFISGREQEVTVHLPIASGRLVNVPLETRTVWTQLDAGEWWHAGLRIHRVTPEAVRDLRLFVDRLKRSAGTRLVRRSASYS